MRPTVDNVYSRWRSLYHKDAHIVRVPFTCGIPMASEDVGFLDFSTSLLQLFRPAPFTHMGRSHEQQAD